MILDDTGASTCVCPQCGTAVDVAQHTLAAAERAERAERSERAERPERAETPERHEPAAPDAGEAAAQLQLAYEQIQALQVQVSVLDQKAAAAVDRWADYEDELMELRQQLAAANGALAQSPGSQNKSTRPTPTIVPPPPVNAVRTTTPVTPVTPGTPNTTSFLPAAAAKRISALLSSRSAKSTSNLKDAAQVQPTPSAAGHGPTSPLSPVTPPPSRTTYGSFSLFGAKPQTPQTPPAVPVAEDKDLSTEELMEALTREQELRRDAEDRLHDTSREVEELSVSLFEQANEMVAEERRARARLEARIAVLEQRDSDKKARLDRLEAAMQRIERVRALLDETTTLTLAAAAKRASTPAVDADQLADQPDQPADQPANQLELARKASLTGYA